MCVFVCVRVCASACVFVVCVHGVCSCVELFFFHLIIEIYFICLFFFISSIWAGRQHGLWKSHHVSHVILLK